MFLLQLFCVVLLGFALQKLVGFLVVSCYPEFSSGKSTEQKMDNDNFSLFFNIIFFFFFKKLCNVFI